MNWWHLLGQFGSPGKLPGYEKTGCRHSGFHPFEHVPDNPNCSSFDSDAFFLLEKSLLELPLNQGLIAVI